MAEANRWAIISTTAAVLVSGCVVQTRDGVYTCTNIATGEARLASAVKETGGRVIEYHWRDENNIAHAINVGNSHEWSCSLTPPEAQQ